MPLPRLYLNHCAELDWLAALEFGRTDDGQDPAAWRPVGDGIAYLHAADTGDEVGFAVDDFATFDVEDPAHEEIWDGPRFDVPVLGLSDACAGEIVLAARALFGEAESANRWFFRKAIGTHGEDALTYWLACLQTGDSMAHYGLGYTLFELGRFLEAYRHLRHYTEIAPFGSWPWCWRGMAAEAIGEVAEAREAYRRAIELEEEHDREETDARERLEALEM